MSMLGAVVAAMQGLMMVPHPTLTQSWNKLLSLPEMVNSVSRDPSGAERCFPAENIGCSIFEAIGGWRWVQDTFSILLHILQSTQSEEAARTRKTDLRFEGLNFVLALYKLFAHPTYANEVAASSRQQLISLKLQKRTHSSAPSFGGPQSPVM